VLGYEGGGYKTMEMKMLRMIYGKTMRDKVRNEEIRERTEVESIERAFERTALALVSSHGL